MTNNTYILAVNSISGGGKTTVTKALGLRLPNARALYFDDRDYDSASGIDDICKWVEDGADANQFNLTLLEEDIILLLQDNPDFILLDYPFGYRNSLIAKYIDASVYIDTPLDIALARRILRDYDSQAIPHLFDDIRQYLTQGRGAYLSGQEMGKEGADFIVDGSGTVGEIAAALEEYALKNRQCKVGGVMNEWNDKIS